MTYRGRVQNGVIVYHPPGALPDGTDVNIEPVSTPPAITKDSTSIWDDFLELAGTVEGLPEDFADEHDHYIHGTPKRK